jgi:hypothetical protein
MVYLRLNTLRAGDITCVSQCPTQLEDGHRVVDQLEGDIPFYLYGETYPWNDSEELWIKVFFEDWVDSPFRHVISYRIEQDKTYELQLELALNRMEALEMAVAFLDDLVTDSVLEEKITASDYKRAKEDLETTGSTKLYNGDMTIFIVACK